MDRKYYSFVGIYAFTYIAIGMLLPLLGQYLASIGFSGVQIGFITATATATRQSLIVDTPAAADNSFGQHLPGKAEARAKVGVVGWVEALHAGAARAGAGEDKRARTSTRARVWNVNVNVRIAVATRNVPADRDFVTHAEVQSQLGGDAPVVLEVHRSVVINCGVE